MELKNEKCVPCEEGGKPLHGQELRSMHQSISPEWKIVDEKFLKRVFKFKNFKEALKFVNRVGEAAEAEGHHPDIKFGWGRVEVEFTTHKINGLSKNDFIMASKTDELAV